MSNNILMMENRQLIPRWHTSRKVFKFSNFGDIKANEKDELENDFWFNKSLNNWISSPTTSNAIDVFVRFIQEDVKNNRYFNTVHRQLLDQFDNLSKTIQQLVLPELKQIDQSVGYSTDPNKVFLIIRKLKNIVNANPKDSLTWMDLGFYYSVIGEYKKAEYCTEVAKNLDPNSAYIARSYSRFMVQIGDPEQAVWFLKKQENIKTNPLLLSAYIAIGSAYDMQIPNIKKAISIVDNWKKDPFLISELAATLGTIEIQNGASKMGKKHLQQALKQPSENVMAHVKWLHHKHHINITNIPKNNISIEGGVTELYAHKKFTECRDKLIEMYSFQPYSVGPIVDAGYLSIAALNDPQFAIDLSNNRISKSHMEFGELNNLIVAKLMKNQVSDIDVDLRLLSRRVDNENPDSRATLSATLGMALISNGMLEEGMNLYEKSIQILKSNNSERLLCIAYHFYSKQLETVLPQKAKILKGESRKLAIKYGVLELINDKPQT